MENLLNPTFAPIVELGIQNIALLLLRITFGGIFLYYGIPKIRDLKANAQDFEEMGFTNPSGWFWGTPVALLETVGSVAIILGIFTWFFALAFAIHMLVGTVWKISSTDKPFKDWSYDVLLLSLAIMLLITGPGTLNLQAMLGIGI